MNPPALPLLLLAALVLAPRLHGKSPAKAPVSERRIWSTELSAEDLGFLRKTNAVLLEQQAMARVASQRAAREEVRDFAASVQRQLQVELDALREVAKAQRVPLEDHMDSEAMERAIALRKEDPSQVDTRFLTSLITGRSGQITDFQAAMTSTVPAIRTVAETALTAIKDELLFIQVMSSRVEKPPDASPSPEGGEEPQPGPDAAPAPEATASPAPAAS